MVVQIILKIFNHYVINATHQSVMVKGDVDRTNDKPHRWNSYIAYRPRSASASAGVAAAGADARLTSRLLASLKPGPLLPIVVPLICSRHTCDRSIAACGLAQALVCYRQLRRMISVCVVHRPICEMLSAGSAAALPCTSSRRCIASGRRSIVRVVRIQACAWLTS